MANLDILTQPFPAAAVKQRTIGGGFQASYVDGITIVRRLNEATGNEWDFTVDRYWIEGNLSYALVTLELPGHGKRQHIGVQAINERSGEDAIAKGAITDGLKKAATLFGVGAELYGPDYEFGHGEMVDSPRQVAILSPVATVSPHPTSRPPAGGSGPSPAQFGMMHGVARRKGVDPVTEAGRLFGVSSLDELTGGREGTASRLIDHLQRLDEAVGGDPAPAHRPDPASAAAGGMTGGAVAYWSGKVERMNSVSGVDAVLAEAMARFQGNVPETFLNVVDARRAELGGRG